MKSLHYFPHILLVIPFSMANVNLKKPPEDDFQKPSEPRIGPKGMPYNKTTSCDTFGKYARFNPHSIVGIKWFVFFYWASPQALQVYEFQIPTKNETKLLHSYLDGHLPKRFSWSSTLVLRKNLLTNVTTLLEEKGDRGEYLEYSIYDDIPKGKLTFFKSLRIKQTGDSKYLGIADCKGHTAFIMSHLDAVPPQDKLQVEAGRLGYRGRRGKSYLYQGHEWMPIKELDEKVFWFINRELKKL